MEACGVRGIIDDGLRLVEPTLSPELRSRNGANSADTQHAQLYINLAAQIQIPTVHSGDERESSLIC